MIKMIPPPAGIKHEAATPTELQGLLFDIQEHNSIDIVG